MVPWLTRAFLLLAVLTFAGTDALAAQAPHSFSDTDAAQILDRFRQSLETHSQDRLLKLFDAPRISGFAALRDQIIQFFEKYQAFSVRYQLTQVANENDTGIAIADLTMEATPKEGDSTVRRNLQLRMVLIWDGKQWKIVDFAPLNLFE